MYIFFDEMSKYFGPKSGTGRILALDGEYSAYILPEIGPMLDYVISQAYASYGYDDLDYRIYRLFTTFPDIPKKELAAKFIVAENFESYAASGGINATTRDGQWMASSLMMADWQPIVDGEPVRKGGAGAYHMEYEFNFFRDYRYLREMIHIMGQHTNE
jgi:hypothetical protein